MRHTDSLPLTAAGTLDRETAVRIVASYQAVHRLALLPFAPTTARVSVAALVQLRPP